MRIILPEEIKYIFQNYPDIKTGESRGWTVGLLNGVKQIIPDDIGEKLALVMEERGKKEYKGQLVTPKGDPLTEVMKTGIRIDQKELDLNVVKKKL